MLRRRTETNNYREKNAIFIIEVLEEVDVGKFLIRNVIYNFSPPPIQGSTVSEIGSALMTIFYSINKFTYLDCIYTTQECE